jgi:hypothetical protein
LIFLHGWPLDFDEFHFDGRVDQTILESQLE